MQKDHCYYWNASIDSSIASESEVISATEENAVAVAPAH